MSKHQSYIQMSKAQVINALKTYTERRTLLLKEWKEKWIRERMEENQTRYKAWPWFRKPIFLTREEAEKSYGSSELAQSFAWWDEHEFEKEDLVYDQLLALTQQSQIITVSGHDLNILNFK